MRVQYPKCAHGPYCLFNPIQNGVYILAEVSFHIVMSKIEEVPRGIQGSTKSRKDTTGSRKSVSTIGA